MRAEVRTLIGIATVLAAALTLSFACGGEDDSKRGTGPTPSTGAHMNNVGGTDVATGMCDAGERRECKVQIDANNCFVGEQECEDTLEWGPCTDPEKLDTASLSAPGPCTGNDCNPQCQSFDEVPGTPIVNSGSGNPPRADRSAAFRRRGRTRDCAISRTTTRTAPARATATSITTATTRRGPTACPSCRAEPTPRTPT